MTLNSNTAAAVIVDLVRSRQQPDRAAAQEALVAALSRVNDAVPALQPLAPTVGDESQALYPDVRSAVHATLLLRLHLPDPLDCRFGIGRGSFQTVGSGDRGDIQDGPAWWTARDAIIEAKTRESGRHPTLRTWYLASAPAADGPEQAMTNSYLMCRDQIVSTMSARSKRLLLGLLDGHSQARMAAAEQITQSAVSQNLRRSGAYSVVGGTELLAPGFIDTGGRP